MRVKINTNKEVVEVADREALWRQIQASSEPVKHLEFKAYLDGVRARAEDFKLYLTPPESVRSNDKAYAEWMFDEFKKAGRLEETDEPTTEEVNREKERKKAEAAKARAEAEKKKAEAAKAAGGVEAKPAAPAAKPAPKPPQQTE